MSTDPSQSAAEGAREAAEGGLLELVADAAAEHVGAEAG
jgi:hypothetical protein